MLSGGGMCIGTQKKCKDQSLDPLVLGCPPGTYQGPFEKHRVWNPLRGIWD